MFSSTILWIWKICTSKGFIFLAFKLTGCWYNRRIHILYFILWIIFIKWSAFKVLKLSCNIIGKGKEINKFVEAKKIHTEKLKLKIFQYLKFEAVYKVKSQLRKKHLLSWSKLLLWLVCWMGGQSVSLPVFLLVPPSIHVQF